MLKWALVAMIWITLVGGLSGYLALCGRADLPERRQLLTSEAALVMRLRSTHALGGEADPFASNPEAAGDAVTVRWSDASGVLQQAVVPRLEADQAREVSLGGLVLGRNDVNITVADPAQAMAVEMGLLRDGQIVWSQVLWLDPGQQRVEQAIVDLTPNDTGTDHEH